MSLTILFFFFFHLYMQTKWLSKELICKKKDVLGSFYKYKCFQYWVEINVWANLKDFYNSCGESMIIKVLGTVV